MFVRVVTAVFLLCACQCSSQPNEEGCEDIIGSHPVCLFGSMCNCTELTSAESTPCGSVLSGGGQDVAVNEICASTCGACGEEEPSSPCADEIQDHPLCLFGRMCDCATESLPCGGEVRTQQGTVAVNDVCASTCDACSGGSDGKPIPPAFAGPVEGHVPMGTIDGKKSDVFYTVFEDRIDFTLRFPNTSAWAAFQFWGGDFRGITDGRLPQATSGYECLVTSNGNEVITPSENRQGGTVKCRARRVRHLFTSFKDLPAPSSALLNSQSVASCTPERASIMVESTGEAYCSYNPESADDTSLIISSSTGGELVFVTDVVAEQEADMFNVQTSFDSEAGMYVATWSRSRSYPWRLDGDGNTLQMRWAVSPQGASSWEEGGLQYHGPKTYRRWPFGNSFFFTSQQVMDAHDAKYLEEAHAHTAGYSEIQIKSDLRSFQTPQENPDDGGDENEITSNESSSTCTSPKGVIAFSALALYILTSMY